MKNLLNYHSTFRFVLAGSGGLLLLGTLLACQGGRAKVAPARVEGPSEPAKGGGKAPEPRATALEPGSGTPGTMVLIHGEGLTQDARVHFNANPAQGAPGSAEVQWVDEHTLKTWVPEGATSGGVQVTTSAGPASFGDFQVLPSRGACLGLPLLEVPDSNDGHGRKLDFPSLRRTAQYESLAYPKAPIFHPYHPLEDGSLRHAKVASQITLNLQLPESFRPALPDSVQAKLKELGLAPGQVDILVVSQDQPWTAGTPMLFRPHYWTDPEAPSHGTYDTHTTVHAGFFEAEPGVQFHGYPHGAFIQQAISVHPGDGGVIVSSPDVMGVAGLDPGHSQAFWTLTLNGKRAAATLHLILEDKDQDALEALSLQVATVKDLLNGLARSPLATRPIVARLFALGRPLVTGIHRLPGTERGWMIHGNGLTGATAVTLGGEAVPALTVLDDTRIRVEGPRTARSTEAIVVTTPFGESTPQSFLDARKAPKPERHHGDHPHLGHHPHGHRPHHGHPH